MKLLGLTTKLAILAVFSIIAANAVREGHMSLAKCANAATRTLVVDGSILLVEFIEEVGAP